MKKTIILFSVITIIQLGVFNLSAQQKTASKDLYSKIDTYLTASTKNGFAGAIAVVKNGKTIINKGYGMANKDTQTLNNPNTIFDIGSNTKQFTSTAILKLVELGKLKLTDSLGAFFKNLPLKKQSITIHQLLTHSAGFNRAFGGDFQEISRTDFFDELFASELLFKPGTSYSYSNTGYSILARVIELTSLQSYEAFLNDYLFTPAGMQQTGYLLPKWDTLQISHGYYNNVIDKGTMISRYQETGDVTWHLKGNGGINSTQNDMLLWYKALKENKIVTKESFRKLTTAHISNPEEASDYGYGWAVKKSEKYSLRIYHNGGNGTFSHSIIWYPKDDIYVVYATNASSSKVEWLAYRIANIVLNENYYPKPIKENVYSYIMSYINQHSTDKSNKLLTLIQENYPDNSSSSRLLNTTGNVLLRLNENLDWALELFIINVQRHPNDGNLWDSLGDGYKANNQKEDAIKSYQKAIKLGYKDSQGKLTELIKD
mgnify:CR=1 FL=1